MLILLRRSRRSTPSLRCDERSALGARSAAAVTLLLAAVIAGPDLEATFPGEGNGKIAFDRFDGAYTVWVMPYYGANPVNLGTGFRPVWSPDGTQIAFNNVAANELFVMDADGQNRTQIVPGSALFPSWSPDGQFIAYECGSDICRVVVLTHVIQNLTNSADTEGRPDWSPDGTKIAFHRVTGPTYHVFVMDSDGTDPIDLTPVAANYFAPSFKPDGSAIVLRTDQFGNDEIGIIPATGISSPAQVQRVTNHVAGDYAPVWSPDGTLIAFVSTRDGNDEIYTINADLSGSANRTNSPASVDSYPDWQVGTNTVMVQVAVGTSAPLFVAQLESGWDLGDFSCSGAGGGSSVISIEQPTSGVQRNFAYSLNSGGQSTAIFNYTVRLQRPPALRAPDGGAQVFAAFVSVDGGPEVELNDGPNSFTTNGGDSLGTTVTTFFPDGQTCLSGAECVSGFCIDGFCCDSSCMSLCNACNRAGLAGTCGPIAHGSDPLGECPGSRFCNGAGQCSLDNGQSCGNGSQCTSGFCTDGFCCDSSCMSLCNACNRAGLAGTCGPIAHGSDPLGECPGSRFCNGAGQCSLDNGQSCGNGSECTSGFCVNGVCCNNTCLGVCKACDVSGSAGSCSFVPSGTDPDNECATVCSDGACAATGGGGNPAVEPTHRDVPALGRTASLAAILGLVALGCWLIVLRR